MTWAVFVIGLLLTTLGATAGSALIATSRSELARFASTQLRGGGMPRELYGIARVFPLDARRLR